eukprot:112081-Pleurochrysis_carterae.AAC.6
MCPTGAAAVPRARLFGLAEYVSACAIWPSREAKRDHLETLARTLQTPLSQLVLLDDVKANVNAARAIGCVGVLVAQGLACQEVVEALQQWRRAHDERGDCEAHGRADEQAGGVADIEAS